MAPKQATVVPEPPSKKRKTAASTLKSAGGPAAPLSTTASTSASPVAPSPAPVSASATPLSAVAARKAAALAAALSATSSATSSVNGDSTPLPTASPRPDDDDHDEQVRRALSYSSASDQESDGELLKKTDKVLKRRQVAAAKAKAAAAGKQKAGRYFAGGDDENRGRNGNDGRALVEGQGDGEAEGNPFGGPSASVRVKMGRGKRQRREKSAFSDPMCVSNFSTSWGVNAHRVSWVLPESQAPQDGVVLCLETGQTLIIHGTYTLSPIFGSVSILSSTLSAPPSASTSFPPPSSNQHQVFAPSSHPLPVLTALQLPLGSSTDPLLLPSGERVDLTAYSAAVLICDLTTGVEGVEHVLRSSGMGCGNGMWEAESGRHNWGGRTWKLVCDITPTLTSVRTLDTWSAALDQAVPSLENGEEEEQDGAERLVAIVEGPKRVGKSTFSKLLLNKLLSRYEQVAYIDTDLGQPEFTTPGFVSLNVLSRPLLGPSFTHLSLPVSSHFLGTLSPASDPAAYLSAISSLLSTFELEVEYPVVDNIRSRRPRNGTSATRQVPKTRDRVPLIINTQGWVKGLGADLLQKLKDLSRPTHVFSFESEDERNLNEPTVRPHGFLAQDHPRDGFFAMASAPSSPLESKWSAADLRTLSFISYFHATFAAAPTTSAATNSFPLGWDFSKALVTRPPFEVSWAAEAEQIESAHVIGEEIAPKQILRVLNASIVAIVASSELSSTGAEINSTVPFPFDPEQPFPSPTTSRAVSLAVIRSISPSTKTLHLLTPIHPSYLTQPVSLVKGALELPAPLWIDFLDGEEAREKGVCGVEWGKVPYIEMEGGDGGRKRARRNLMRRGQN